jgi:CRP-like cAMP-binding protein
MLPNVKGYPVDRSAAPRVPNQSTRIQMLRQVPLFAGLSSRNLVRIDKIARVGNVGPGRVLMTEGAPGNELLIVLEGRAEVRRGDAIVGECGPGEWVGEMALLDDQPRSASVVALEPMRLLAISRADFRKLLPKAPRLAETLLASLSMRIRAAESLADTPSTRSPGG